MWQDGCAFGDSWRHGRKTPSGPRGSSGIRTMLVELFSEGIFVPLKHPFSYTAPGFTVTHVRMGVASMRRRCCCICSWVMAARRAGRVSV